MGPQSRFTAVWVQMSTTLTATTTAATGRADILAPALGNYKLNNNHAQRGGRRRDVLGSQQYFTI